MKYTINKYTKFETIAIKKSADRIIAKVFIGK